MTTTEIGALLTTDVGASITKDVGALKRTRDVEKIKKEWLDNENVTIVLQKELNTSFFFVEDNADGGIDPVRSFIHRGESTVRELYHHLLFVPNCLKNDESGIWGAVCHNEQKKQTVIDIGANRGYYSLLAASYGHNVITLEPQPHCSFLLRTCIVLNGLQQNIDLRPKFVSTDRSASMKIKRRTGCTGTFPNDNEGGWADGFRRPLTAFAGADDEVVVHSARLDEVVSPDKDISLLKIDVEGFENQVIESGQSLFLNKKVKNLVMELNVWMLKRQEGGWEVMKKKTLSLVTWLSSLGYNSKVSVRGHWKIQSPMKISEWKDLLDDGSLVALDAWFYL